MILIPDEPTPRERDEQKDRSSGTGRRSRPRSTKPGPDQNPGKDSGRSDRPKPHDEGVPR